MGFIWRSEVNNVLWNVRLDIKLSKLYMNEI